MEYFSQRFQGINRVETIAEFGLKQGKGYSNSKQAAHYHKIFLGVLPRPPPRALGQTTSEAITLSTFTPSSKNGKAT